MGRGTELHLYEEILLIALRREKGTSASGMVAFALGGALLADLSLAGRIAIEPGKKHLVDVTGREPVGDPLLDEALEKIASAKRRASAQRWVMRLAQLKHLTRRAAVQLCRRGILREDEDKVLLFFTRRIYPESDPRAEREIVERLQRAVFTETPDLDRRTVLLISLAHAVDLLKRVLDRKRLKKRKARIRAIVNGEVAGGAARDAVAQATAAAMVAVMAGVTAASNAARH